jgi:stearoyl-CoA desaturase (delta-9 desaturase)
VQSWEFDIGWFFIRVFRQLGLARVRYEAPRPRFEPQRIELDADTVQALFRNRMHVLREYARHVVLPVCRELARREPRGSVPAVTPKLLIRHPTLLAEEARRALRDLLERYEVLRRVVEYRDGLQHLWNEASANQAKAVAQLKEWCDQAEASGIRALREFSLGLPAYASAR